jgi:nitroreductase
MPALTLSVDELLTTTRSVRKRLDLKRPVEPEVIRECLELAVQAPSPGNHQGWHFIIVSDPAQREAMGALYRKGAHATGQEEILRQIVASASDEEKEAKLTKMADTARYLTQHVHEVPVLVVPCIEGRVENISYMEQAAHWGGIWPATWSFMLAARSRGLGTVLTTLHLAYEQEAANVLGIAYDQVMQVGLIPVAYTLGTSFRSAVRKPVDSVLHWNHW